MKKPKPAPAPSKPPVVPLVAVAAVIAIAAAVWYSRSHDPASATKPAGSAAGASSATPGGPQTTLSVSASPPDAKLFIDDLPLDGNPYKGAFARDGHAHRLRAEAKGFIDRTDVVVFDRDDVATTLSLRQRPRIDIDSEGKPIVARPPGSATH